MQLSITTRLDAINYVIGCIGLSPVADEDEYNLDVAMAVQAIEYASRRIQDNKGRGWWFNREFNWKLLPDPVTKVVSIPNNVLACYYKDKMGRQQRMSTRGRALYDTKQYRFDMTTFADSDGYLNLTFVTQLEFDDLPYTVKDAIATAAGLRFASSNEMEVNRIKVLSSQADDSFFSLQAEDTSQTKNNAFTDNASMMQFGIVGGGYNNGGI